MGKIRVKTLGDKELEEKQKKEKEKRAEVKKLAQAKGEQAKGDSLQKQGVSLSEDKKPAITETQKSENLVSSAAAKKTSKKKVSLKKRSKRYKESKVLVEKKPYSMSEALDLLEKLKRAKFDETVELHINAITAVSGSLTLPHGTGKKTKVVIADDKVLADVEKGKIDFDILVATPQMMPKLAKVARILGPKGLMPNPKNGTITATPEEVVKKYEGGQINFKCEAKNPILHLSIGKISFGKQKLSDNVKTVFGAIQTGKIRKVVLKSTMSPAIRIDLAQIS